ncbi:MAG: MFS transporter [Geminicoccales bacterium]
MINWWNLSILGIANALNRSVSPMVTFVGGLVGIKLASNPIWATVAPAILVIGMGLSAYPVASLMGRIGRRNGFLLLSLIGAVASSVAALAIMAESYVVFCAAMLGIGANIACVQQYRFAAAENIAKERASTAISLVLFTGVAAAFIGPEVGVQAKEWIENAPFAGSFLVLAALGILTTIVLAFYQDDASDGDADVRDHEHARPLRDIAGQTSYRIATLCGMVAYGVMSLIMTATPISMHLGHGFSLRESGIVMQSHVAAMYLPSLITGKLISSWGLGPVMLAGLVLMAACLLINLAHEGFGHFWVALVCLGIGWNFLFVAGTSLLNKSYRRSERFKAEGLNDGFVFTTMAVVALGAGVLVELVGWRWTNIAMIPILAGTGFMLILGWRHLDSASHPTMATSPSKYKSAVIRQS